MAKEEKKEDKEEGAATQPSTMKVVLIAVVIAVLLSGGIVGGGFFVLSTQHAEQLAAAAYSSGGEGDGEGGSEVAAESMAPPQYHSMDPKFVISFNDDSGSRFMQFSVEVMTRDKDVIKKIEEHMPVIRSSLLMLFGNQKYDQMLTREGKEKLLATTTDDINATLQKISGSATPLTAVEESYFTSFVIQ